jgi:hypothetical protein
VDPAGKTVSRSLVVTNADGDTLSVSSCAVPATRVGMQLADSLFDNVASFTTARRVRSGRRGSVTILQLSSPRAQRPVRSSSRLNAPVCVSATACVALTSPKSVVSLSGQYVPPPPPDPWADQCEWDYFYGCQFSVPNGGGGGGGSWDPDVINNGPSDDSYEFVCGTNSPKCLVELTPSERRLVENAMSRILPDAELSEPCRNAALVLRAYYNQGQIYTGINGPGQNGKRHSAATGTDLTAGSPTYGRLVIHVDRGFMNSAELSGVLWDGYDFDEIDLINVLLHEAMHAVSVNQLPLYTHGENSTAPYAEAGFNLVNPRYLDSGTGSVVPASKACVR